VRCVVKRGERRQGSLPELRLRRTTTAFSEHVQAYRKNTNLLLLLLSVLSLLTIDRWAGLGGLGLLPQLQLPLPVEVAFGAGLLQWLV